MWLKLARLWGCSIGEAQQRCPAGEFPLWMAEYRRDPWGGDRADLRAGIIASTIVNVNRGKNSKPAKASDFMPQYGQAVEQGSKTEAEKKAIDDKNIAFFEGENARKGNR